jgi:hypothetical protein
VNSVALREIAVRTGPAITLRDNIGLVVIFFLGKSSQKVGVIGIVVNDQVSERRHRKGALNINVSFALEVVT